MIKKIITISTLSMMLWFMGANVTYSYEITSKSIISHIEVLAHDSLEGREVGEIETMRLIVKDGKIYKNRLK